MFSDGSRGQDQLPYLESALKGLCPGIQSVDGFEVFSNLRHEQLSRVAHFHSGVLQCVARCLPQLPSGVSFVQRLQEQDADLAIEHTKDFIAMAAETVHAVYRLTTANSNDAHSPFLLDYAPFSVVPAVELLQGSENFQQVLLDSQGSEPGWPSVLPDSSQPLAVLVTAQEHAATSLPTLLEDLPADRLSELQTLLSHHLCKDSKWQQACLVAILLRHPKHVQDLQAAITQQSETAELAVILHVECEIAGRTSAVFVDVRLDARAETVVSGIHPLSWQLDG